MGQYISQLSALDTLTSGDNIAVGSASYGDDRRSSLTTLLSFLQSNLTFSSFQYTTQYAAPSATGQTIQITDGDANIHLIIIPVAGYAAMTITLPTSSNAIDKQDILINCTQNVTTLTVDGNGASVVGEPASITANDFFRLKYDLPGTTWYRVG